MYCFWFGHTFVIYIHLLFHALLWLTDTETTAQSTSLPSLVLFLSSLSLCLKTLQLSALVRMRALALSLFFSLCCNAVRLDRRQPRLLAARATIKTTVQNQAAGKQPCWWPQNVFLPNRLFFLRCKVVELDKACFWSSCHWIFYIELLTTTIVNTDLTKTKTLTRSEVSRTRPQIMLELTGHHHLPGF